MSWQSDNRVADRRLERLSGHPEMLRAKPEKLRTWKTCQIARHHRSPWKTRPGPFRIAFFQITDSLLTKDPPP